jgi:hypothetical protein
MKEKEEKSQITDMDAGVPPGKIPAVTYPF